MSALLSPPRPVRTRFKVPGEGAYELCADLAPPPSPIFASPPATSSTPSASKPSTPSTSQPAAPAAPAFVAGPLGLPKVTKLSFAERSSLAPVVPARAESVLSDSSAPGSPAPAASSMFSFRKLTGLGSSLSAKFSSSADDEPSQHVTAATASPRPDDGPRFPPRVAAAAARRDARRRPDETLELHDVAGVLAYNASDAVVIVDMRLHADAPGNAEPSLTLQSRSPPSSQSLHPSGDALKLLVGCVNGEVLYYPDIVSAGGEAGKKSRTVSAVATLASVASVMNGSSSPAVPQHFVYNKDGATNSTRVVSVSWVPGSPYRFMSVHDDGAIVVYDARFKPSPGSLRATVGGATTAQAAPPPNPPPVQASTAAPGLQAQTPSFDSSGDGSNSGSGIGASQTPKSNGTDRGNGDKAGEKGEAQREKERERSGLSSGSGEKASSTPSTHRRAGSSVSSAGSGAAGSIGQHDILVTKQVKGKRSNPVAVWQVGKATVTACEFCPVANGESRLMALTGRDGYIRILDFTKETPIAAYRSYFGAFLCVAWSPDGKYVATGGEDDLVSIWCPWEGKLVARLEGHTSWVSAVAWDGSLSAPGRYRIGSAGQDAKLLLWDFALDVLHHRSPQARLGTGIVRLRSYVRDVNIASHSGGVANGPVGNGASAMSERRTSKLSRLRGHASGVGQGDAEASAAYALPVATPRVVSALGRAEVPIVEPVVAHVAHGEPLTDVWFQDCGVFTADSAGTVKMWSRPAAHAVPELSLEAPALTPARKGVAADLD